jgi:hypothetical protein
LCHPFPIDPEASVELEGRTKGYVLFHNGTWHSWKTTLLEAVVHLPAKVPLGKWSDSRAMAWSAAHFGIGFLELIDEKSVAFGVKDLEAFGTGWTVDKGVWASNRFFDFDNRQGSFSDTRTMCRDRNCTVRHNLDAYGYCHLHTFKGVEDKSKALVVVGKAVEGTEVALAETPFTIALRLFKDGKISKNQFKRMKRDIDNASTTLMLN